MDGRPQEIGTFSLRQGLDAVGTGPISVSPYVSEQFFEDEKRIWRDSWLMLGRERDLGDPGAYIVCDLKVLDVSIVVTRNRDGRLHAFYNVCSHRASRLLCESHGRKSVIVCPFHSWTFNVDGSLRGVPEKQLFDCMENKEKYRLTSVSVDTWGGFVFVNLSPEPRYSLSEYTSGTPEMLGPYLKDQPWSWHTGYQHRFDANWKDLMNIQHEGYHASYVHRQTLGAKFGPDEVFTSLFPDSPGFCSLLTVNVPPAPGNTPPKFSTVQQLAMEFGTTSNWVGKDTSQASTRFPGAVNQNDSVRWVFDCYTLFPNLMLFVGNDVLSVMRVWPLNAHEADWEWDWFFKDEMSNFGHLFNREHGRLATRNALTEDWPICEMVHRNMRAGIVDKVHIGSEMEVSVRALHEKLLMHMNLTEDDLDAY